MIILWKQIKTLLNNVENNLNFKKSLIIFKDRIILFFPLFFGTQWKIDYCMLKEHGHDVRQIPPPVFNSNNALVRHF